LSAVQTLQRELARVSCFYLDEAARLQNLLEELQTSQLPFLRAGLSLLRHDLQDLTKYAALNYVAVLKAVKKRNRRLRDACGDQVVTVAPFSVLQNQAFFMAAELQQIGGAALALDPV
jgi:membrane-bound lytic murein transglycosylase MltF